MTMRVQGWDIALDTVIQIARQDTFEWGRNDCVLFAARCVEAVTGTHPCPELIGAYDTQAGALAALSGAGYATLGEAFEAVVGAPKPVAMAQRGDLLTFGDFVAGVVSLDGQFAIGLDAEAGIVLAPVLSAVQAFTVG